MKRLIGCVFLGVAGLTLAIGGLGCNTWEFWVITLCFIYGGALLNDN